MNFLAPVFDVFTAIGNWFVELMPVISQIFWTTTENGGFQLTVIGIFSLIAVGLAIIFKVFHMVRSFIRLR